MNFRNYLVLENWKLKIVLDYFRAWLRWATKSPQRKIATLLLVTMFLDQFVYPIIPLLHPKTVSANGSIEIVDVGPELFINRNPDFNVRFGDRINPAKHKVVFESAGKELELRLLNTSPPAPLLNSGEGGTAVTGEVVSNELTSEITALQNRVGEVLGEVAQLSDQLRADLQRPILTTVERPEGLADAIEQKIADTATIRYEILPNRGAKESIILSEKGAASNQLTFLMRTTPGVELHQQLETLNAKHLEGEVAPAVHLPGDAFPPTPQYYFTDSNGKYLYHFEAPFMEDAAKTRSTDVFYKIEKIDDASSFIQANSLSDFLPGNNYYKLTLVASDLWLSASDRVYPVTIDPTIVHDQNPDFSSGTENRTQVNTSSAVEGQYKELQPDINTAGLWHFNEGSGTTAYDASGNAKNGTLTNGPVWNGPIDTLVGLGKSNLSFDNVDDYVAVGALTSSAVVKSVEFWAYPKSTSTEFVDLNGSAYINAASGTVAATGFTSPTIYVNGVVSSTIVANQWQHIAVTTTTALNASATNFGKRATSYFNGYMDEVRISNIARTPEEIAASASRFPYAVHESPVIDFGTTPNTLDSLNYSATGVQTGDGERPYSRDGLVAQWNFNETSGTVAYNTAGSDSCGGTPSNCNGTLQNFASTASQDQAAGTGWTANNKRWGAGALNFDGTNDNVKIANDPSLNLSLPLSLNFWMKSTSTAWSVLLSRTVTVGVAWNYMITTNDNGAKLRIALGATGYNAQQVNVTDGNWHHVAVTISGAGSLQWYVDGIARESYTGVTTSTGTSVICIGAYQTDASTCSNTYQFSGTLDSLKIYNRVQTAAEVLSDSQSHNLEFQTRTGATSTPNDGTWEAWKTTSGTGDIQIASMDSDSANWTADTTNPASGGITKSNDSTTKIEGTGSLKNQIGAPQVDANTVGLWHMEETSGTGAYLKDSTANANHGTPTGTTVVDGFYGKARDFNGSGNYISTSINFTAYSSGITLDAWIKKSTSTNGYVISNGGGSSALYGVDLIVNGTTASLYGGKGTGGVGNFGCNGTTDVTNGKWHHITGSWDGTTSSNGVKVYVDGVLEAQCTAAATISSSSYTYKIGVHGDTSSATYVGSIDEVRITNAVRSAEEIAEAYRAGRDHRLTKTITSTDLSAKTKLPFYVAADRPGTYLEATIGESAFANYEPDANTVGLWHLEEAAGSGSYIKDSSGRGNDTTPTGTTFVQGKVGKGRSFNGSSDYLSCTDATCGGSSKLEPTGSMTLSAWIKTTNTATQMIIAKCLTTDCPYQFLTNSSGQVRADLSQAGSDSAYASVVGGVVNDGNWHFVSAVLDGTTSWSVYIDGKLSAVSTTFTGTRDVDSTASFRIGAQDYVGSNAYFNGSIDEARMDTVARSPDEIRQAYEIGKRTHPVTIDFKADLDSSNLIANTSDLSFAINPDVDTAGVGEPLNIAKGEKIIVRENVSGTEYIAQGTVTAVTYASGISNANAPNQNATNASTTTVTVSAWDSGATVPTGGFTTAATVFKWQREFFDLTQIPLSTQRDAITRITLRMTDGSAGANVWLDDFESADYSDGSRVAIGSTAQRYFQYRAILNGSPALTNVTINYNSGTTPQPPRTKDASSDFSSTGASLNRVTDTGSSNSPSLELAYKELPKDINTVGLWHMNNNWNDSSGNGYNGTATNAVFTTSAKLGSHAGSFDGTGDYVTTSNIGYFAGATKATWEAWVYMNSLASDITYLSKYDGTNSAGFELAWYAANGFIVYPMGASFPRGYTGTSGYAANTWYHVAVTYDGSGNSNTDRLKIFINGVDTSLTFVGTIPTSLTSTTASVLIGAAVASDARRSWNGYIDEVRISNVARTPEEIKLDAQRRPYGVYTSDVQNLGTNVSSIDNLRWTENGVQTGDGETPYNSNGLVAAWNFNETSGTTASNAAGAGSCGGTPANCNATLNNFASTSSQDQAAGTGWTKDNRKWGAGAIMIASAATADTITVSDPASNTLDPNSADLTISMWVKTTDTTAELFSNNANNGTACTANGYYLGIDASGYPVFYLDTNGVTAGCDAQISTGITTKINDGQWHYLTVAVTRGTSALLYLDGVQIGSDTSVTSYSSITVTGSIQIASNANYDGVIDVINFYSRALAATEILSNYQAGNIEFQTRTSADNATWEAWKPTTSETALDAVDSLSPVEKISQTGLTAYWKLDETSGSRADSKGTNTLTDNNTVTYAPGRLGNAGQFTAANSEYLSIVDNADLSLGTDTDFTLTTWVYLDSLPASGANYAIVDKTIQATPTGYRIIVNNAGGTIRFVGNNWNSTGSGCSAGATTLGTPATNTWYLLTFWHDSTADTCSIQVNGGTVDSSSWTGGTTDNAAPFRIGANETPAEFFNGKIDEVAFWKRTLTADERSRLYQDGLDLHGAGSGRIYRTRDTTTKIEGTASEKLTLGSPQVDASTVGLWHLEETSGTGAYIKDATANANHGTPTGTTVVDGFYGKARDFNGTSDRIVSGSTVAGSNTFTWDAWFKLDTIPSGDAYRQVMGLNTTGADSNTSMSVHGTGTPSCTSKLAVYTQGGTEVCSTSNMNTGIWYYAAWVKDGSTSKLYINGVLDSSVSETVASGTQTIIIGANGNGPQRFWDGIIDEVRISNVARSADEIAEAYRAGRDHRISKTITSTDLSAKTKLPFYVASDRPGTFLEATVGESAYANYEPDANTVGLWHLEEQTGSGAYIKDSSGNANNGTPDTAGSAQGKIGKGQRIGSAADTDKEIRVENPKNMSIATNISLDTWVYLTATTSTYSVLMATRDTLNQETYALQLNSASKIVFATEAGPANCISNTALSTNTWYHIVATYNGSAKRIYFNGVLDNSCSVSGNLATGTITDFYIGNESTTNLKAWAGYMDEVRVSTTVRSADDIRQAYEVGRRTHPVTIDFVSSPQAAYSTGTSVTINNPYGTTNLTDTLSIGDTMIFKENVNGTETVSQAAVTNVANTSSTYGTVTLASAPSFPSGGYSTNAKVFKWQREFMDITSSLSNQRDAINRITLRVTDGNQGATVWLDDFKSAGPYLTVGTARTSTIASIPQQFFQYRIIFSTSDTAVTPTLTAVSIQYHSAPKKVLGADTFASGTYDNDGNVQLGSNNVKDVYYYDRTKDQISYALDFDNTNDYVAVGTGPTSVKTVEFWVNPNSTSTEFIDLNGTAYINVSAGTIGTTGFTSPTVYVDGSVSSTIVANKWQHIAVTTGTGLNATALNFGKRATSYFNGIMDEVALYSAALTATQVTTDYNIRRLAGTESNLVALYHFDEGQGTRAYDSVGGFHGTLTNMAATAWVNSQNDKDQSALSQQVLGVDPNWPSGPARRSQALSFDGTDDTTSCTDADCGGTTKLDVGTRDWSVAAWVRHTGSLRESYVVRKGTASDWSYGMYTHSTGNDIVFILYQSDGTAYCSVRTNLAINDSQWHYLVGTFTQATNCKIYQDGLLVNTSTTLTGTFDNDTAAAFSIGDVSGNYFVGQIDEVAIYGAALTAAQVSSNYNARRLKGNETNLLALWHFDEGEDNTCSGAVKDSCDATTNGYDLTNNNSPTWVTDARAIMDNNGRYVALGTSSAVNTDRGMEIKITSTTAFQYRWQGDQTWTTPATSTLSSYSFTSPAQIDSTGVYVGFDTANGVFGDESYFLIPSWALEQFSNADSQNAMRGTKRGFPERSYLIATDKGADILNADDNTLWMRFEQGSGRSLGTDFNNDPSSVSMVHGQLSIATNGTAGTGVYRLDFNRDTVYRYNVTNRTTGNNNIAKRNATDWSWGSADTGQNLIDSIVNDVSLLNSNGRLVMGTANNTGLTKIANIMSNDTSYDYSDVTSNAYNRVRVAENYVSGTGAVGDMYALNSTNNALERWNNVVADVADKVNGTPDATVNATTTPALFASAQTVNDLDVKTGTSLASSGNNTVFVGHNGGTTVFQENRTTLASSSVKYYSKDNVSEEMIGNVGGMWPLDGLNDQSLNANTLTNNNAVTFTTSGVRGKSAHFTAASSQYLSKTDNASLSTGDIDFTIAGWVYLDSKATSEGLVTKWNGADREYAVWYYITTDRFNFQVRDVADTVQPRVEANNLGSPSTGTWYFIVAWHDSIANTINIQVNNGTVDSLAHSGGVRNGTNAFEIGRFESSLYADGRIDEVLFTKTVLSAAQRTQLYVSGKEALNNKYRVKLASDTVNQLAGTINVVKGVAASDQYIFAGTNSTGADDGILSRTLLRGDVTDRTYDESTTDPIITDNDINSVSVSSDGAYIVVGTDDQGITIIHNGSAANRLRSGGRVQGPSKRPLN